MFFMCIGFKIKDVSFGYGETDVLRGVSLEVGQGDMVGVMGPNGAGKSTLIKLMSGVLVAGSGGVYLGDEPIGSIPRKKLARIIGLVPQETHIPFPFSAMEVVLMGRAPYVSQFGFESPRDVAIANDAMDLTDCRRFASRDIGSLSSGERQRVVLARALSQEPKVLLLDEPTTFLDIRHQIELCRLLGDLNRRRKITVVAVMHDLNLAAAFFNRIIFVREGQIVADGPPNDVINEEAIYTAFGANVRVKVDDLGKPCCLPL